MIKTLKLLLLTLLSSIHKSNVEEPVRLEKPTNKKSIKYRFKTEMKKIDWKVIVFIIIVIGLFIITSLIIFKTGSLESTQTYNNRLI